LLSGNIVIYSKIIGGLFIKQVIRISSLIVVFLFGFVSSSYANHPYSPKTHITSTLTNSVDETYCTDITSSNLSLSISNANAMLESILYYRNYDGLSNDKVYWLTYSPNENCSDLTTQELNHLSLRYYIKSVTTPLCDGTSSCIKRYGYSSVNNHSHYQYAIITLKSSSFMNVQEYIVNHETAHFLGLKDGGGSGDCPGSIMHSQDYGCTNGYPANPYTKDINSIVTEINSN
jgi:hypothetical protein